MNEKNASSEERKKIVADLDVLTVGLWHKKDYRKKEAKKFIEKLGNFELVVPSFAFFLAPFMLNKFGKLIRRFKNFFNFFTLFQGFFLFRISHILACLSKYDFQSIKKLSKINHLQNKNLGGNIVQKK